MLPRGMYFSFDFSITVEMLLEGRKNVGMDKLSVLPDSLLTYITTMHAKAASRTKTVTDTCMAVSGRN